MEPEMRCIVCGKMVEMSDQQKHLDDNHLGPHTFWFDGRKHKTMRPSMSMAELKWFVKAPVMYPVKEERDGKETWIGDGEAVDLTHQPHFFAVPPATYGPGGNLSMG